MEKEKIFQSYIDGKCPVCDKHKGMDDFSGTTIFSGKTIAYYFVCEHCLSEYTIGMEKRVRSVESEITFNANE